MKNEEKCLLLKLNDGKSLMYKLKNIDYYEIVNGFLIITNGETKEGFNINNIKMFKEF